MVVVVVTLELSDSTINGIRVIVSVGCRGES